MVIAGRKLGAIHTGANMQIVSQYSCPPTLFARFALLVCIAKSNPMEVLVQHYL